MTAPRSSFAQLAASVEIVLLLVSSGCAGDGRIRPFTSDGCSSFADGTPTDRDRWKSCCYEHDIAYWRGGPVEDRRVADHALWECISEVQDETLADVMWTGVRAGGGPWWPTRYRWGYGWPYGRGYEPLSPEEAEQADRVLEAMQELYPRPPKPTKRSSP